MTTTGIDTTGMSAQNALQTAFGSGGLAAQLGSLTGQSNLNAIGYDEQLANLVNQNNLTAQNALNVGNLPGGAGLQQQAVNDTSAQLAGNLTPGEVSVIQDSMAQRYGAGAGFGADTNTISAAAERAMGLGARDQVLAGMGNLSSLNQMYPRPNLYGVQSNFVSPGDVASLGMQQAKMLQGDGSSGGGGTSGGGAGRGGTTTGGGGSGGTAGGYPSQTGGAGGSYTNQPSVTLGPTGRTPGMTGVQSGMDYTPMTGQWVDNGNGTWTNDWTGQMSQIDPSIGNTSYDPNSDTAYNNYGVDTGGFNQTYYDPTASAAGWSTPEGAGALQQYWLGPNQDWSSYLGAGSYQTPAASDWSATAGDTGGYTGSYGGSSGYTDPTFEDWQAYYNSGGE